MKKYFFIIVMLVQLLMTSCSNTNKESFVYNDNSIYDIYLNHVGNIGFIQVENIEKRNIKYGKLKYIPTKDDNKMISRLVNSADNKVYASVRTPGSNKANRLIVLKNGDIQKEIIFKDNHKPGELINDIENNRVFVEITQPMAAPVRIVNYETDEYYDCPFYIKGDLYSSGIFGDYIYGIAAGAREFLYNDVPNNYIF
ncbi:MAG TPA: hypothetical protein PK604_09040 [Acetivibrio clariflavus]|nr:hypothetical protein [Acetivibrio clariflavus]